MFAGSVCYDEGESEAESQSSSMEMSNPIFQLYEAVRGARNNQGQMFSEPFQQLPSRREYPDYYQQIKQPTSLQQIRQEPDIHTIWYLKMNPFPTKLHSWEEFKKSFFFLLLRAKMKNGEYESVEQIEADLNLMFENAKRYNMPNSSIYKRAFRLQQIMQVAPCQSFCQVVLKTVLPVHLKVKEHIIKAQYLKQTVDNG